MQPQVEELEKKETELSKEHAHLKSQKAKLKTQLRSLTKAYTEGKLGTRDFEASQERLKNELLATEQRLTSLENELRQIRSQKQKVERETLQLRQELSRLGIEVKEVDNLIDKYEKELQALAKTSEETSSKLGLITKGLKGLGALGGAGLLTGAVKGMFDLEAQARRVVFNTTLTWEKHKDMLMRDIAQIKSSTLASYEEISSVLTDIIQQTGQYTKETVKTAEAILLLKDKVQNWDEKEITRAVTQLQKAYKISGEEAIQMIYSVLTKAGDKAGDLLDTFWEYAPLLAEAGIKADELTAILITGAQKGAFNYDKLADTLKEALQARLVEASNLQQLLGDIEQEQAGLIDQLWGRGSKEWLQMKSVLTDYISAIQKGDRELAKSSFVNLIGIVTKAYKKDATKTKEILESIFGSMGAEDLAKKVLEGIAQGIANKDKILSDVKGFREAIEDSKTSLRKLQEAWTSVWQNIVITSRPVFDVLTKGLTAVASFMKEHQTLSTALVGGVATIGSLGIAVKGLSIAFGIAKTGLSTFLIPFKLFKREAQTSCALTQGVGSCIQNKARALRGFGFSLRNVIRSAGSLAGSFRTLAGAGRFLLGGLRLLSLTNPLGLAITGITIFAPKLWNLIGGVEGLKKTFSSVGTFIKKAFDYSPLRLFAKGLSALKSKAQDFVRSLLSGIKSLWTKVKETGSSWLSRGIKAVPVGGAVVGAVEAGRALSAKGEQLINSRTETKVSSKQVNFSPNITINLPSLTVVGSEPDSLKETIINALKEGGEEVKEILRSFLSQIDLEDRPIL